MGGRVDIALAEDALGGSTQRFVPFHDMQGLTDEPGSLHLLERLDVGAGGYRVIWTAEAVLQHEPAHLFAWMWSRPDLWMAWGRIAVNLGPSVLARMVAAEIAAAPCIPPASLRAHEDDAPANPFALAEEEEEVKAPVSCRCYDEKDSSPKGYFLHLSRDGFKPVKILRLRFDTKSPRDRVWDYMKHQVDHYQAYAQIAEERGPEALKKVIFAGMLETERAVKKAGMGSGGARPLRFWPGPEEARHE